MSRELESLASGDFSTSAALCALTEPNRPG